MPAVPSSAEHRADVLEFGRDSDSRARRRRRRTTIAVGAATQSHLLQPVHRVVRLQHRDVDAKCRGSMAEVDVIDMVAMGIVDAGEMDSLIASHNRF